MAITPKELREIEKIRLPLDRGLHSDSQNLDEREWPLVIESALRPGFAAFRRRKGQLGPTFASPQSVRKAPAGWSESGGE
jgi:hypothetical protein